MIRTLPAMQVIYFSTTATLQTLYALVGTVAEELYQQAAASKVLPVGPIQWIYYGADGKPETTFLLEIALPLAAKPNDTGRFQFKELPAFPCLSRVHKGDWKFMYDTYEHLIDDAIVARYDLSGINREQYLLMDFNNPVNHCTEVCVGIQASIS